MLIFLSSAKTLDFSPSEYTKFTTPTLLDDSKQLMDEFKQYSVKDLEKRMKISEKIAKENYERFQNCSTQLSLKNAKQAILAFKGMVYKDIDSIHYTEEDFAFSQKHVRILSGLYGMLRPLDLMQPYRLEMALSHKFWKDKLSKAVQEEPEEILLNLASNEYFGAIGNMGNMQKRVIAPEFKEWKNGKLKMITVFTKQARGTMTNWVIKNKITDPNALKKFDVDGYRYDEKLSEKDKPVFVRGD